MITPKLLFLDFETLKNGHLFLASTRMGKITQTFALCPLLDPLVRRFDLDISTPDEFVANLLRMHAREDISIAGYSEHEATIIKNISGNYPSRFLNVRTLAKRWVNRWHKEAFKSLPSYSKGIKKFGKPTERWSFKTIAKFAGITIPPLYAAGKTTARYKAIVAGLSAKGSFRLLTPTQKRKAGHLIKHNIFDVEGLEALVERIQIEDGAEKFTSEISRILTDWDKRQAEMVGIIS